MNITTHDGLLATIFKASDVLLANIRPCPILQIGDNTYVDATALPPGVQAEMWLTKLVRTSYDEEYADMFVNVQIDVKIYMFTLLDNYNIDDGDVAMLLGNNYPALRQLSNPELRLLTIYCLKHGPETANELAGFLQSLN